MKHFPGRKKRQRGAALLVLAAIVVLGVSWMMISALGNASQRTAANRVHNARLLAEAKEALVAWVAINSLDATENNPGRLPCPQAWGDIGSANEGRAAAVCSATAAGWLPWRTLGLQKPLDASGSQIWYVVSPGWHLPNATASLTINSNTAGQLALDGRAAVALLIAPGAALNIAPNANQTAAGCAARSQVQALNLPATAPNPLDFLECQNATTADNVFTTSVVDNATNPVFNDQVLAITTSDILPALEAAIAKRIESQVIPALKAAYVGTKWNTLAGDTVFPFAASFLPDPGTSSYVGDSLTPLTQGLLPFNYSPPCSPAGDPRCTSSTFHAWGTPTLSKVSGTGNLYGSPTCSVSGATITCQGWYISGALQARFDDPVSNVANALRDFNLPDHTATVWTNLCNGNPCNWDGYQIESSTLSRRFNASASLSFVINIPLRWAKNKDWGYYYIQAQRPAIIDHALLDPSNATTGWFVRNQWYRLLHYAIAAPNHVPGGGGSCTAGATCLQVTVAGVTPTNKERAILILAGRSLTGAARPNGNLDDFLDSAENRDGDSAFEQFRVNASFNDRVVVIDANP